VFNAGAMSHQHLEPKRLGLALAATRDTNVRIREYTDYWTVRTRHPAERGAPIPAKSDPRVVTFGTNRFFIGSLAGSRKNDERGRANVAIFKGTWPARAGALRTPRTNRDLQTG
jgi:hypothetical protein